jgi:hypothetical protein
MNVPQRDIVAITFGDILEDDSKNLIHWFDQYYWAEDLA